MPGGVESTTSGSRPWTGAHGIRTAESGGTSTGRDDRIARFAFTEGGVLTEDSPSLTRCAPGSGADRTTAATAPADDRITLGRRVGGAFRVRPPGLAGSTPGRAA
ncbi:hypothetical protein ABT298_24505, partial [Streptomyces sp. NPDC001034]